MLIFSWLLYQKWILSNVGSCSCSSRSESLKRHSWFVLWLQVYHRLHSTGRRQPAAHLSPAGRDVRTLLLCGRHHLCRDVGADVCRWSWQQVRLMAVRRLRSRIQLQALWGGWTRKHNNTRAFVRTGSGSGSVHVSVDVMKMCVVTLVVQLRSYYNLQLWDWTTEMMNTM